MPLSRLAFGTEGKCSNWLARISLTVRVDGYLAFHDSFPSSLYDWKKLWTTQLNSKHSLTHSVSLYLLGSMRVWQRRGIFHWCWLRIAFKPKLRHLYHLHGDLCKMCCLWLTYMYIMFSIALIFYISLDVFLFFLLLFRFFFYIFDFYIFFIMTYCMIFFDFFCFCVVALGEEHQSICLKLFICGKISTNFLVSTTYLHNLWEKMSSSMNSA